jgi:hypothetical protein
MTPFTRGLLEGYPIGVLLYVLIVWILGRRRR